MWGPVEKLASMLYDKLMKDPYFLKKFDGWESGDYPAVVLEEFDSLTVALQDRVGSAQGGRKEVLGVLTEAAPLSLRVSRRFDIEDVKDRLARQLEGFDKNREKEMLANLSEKEKRNLYFLQERRKQRAERRKMIGQRQLGSKISDKEIDDEILNEIEEVDALEEDALEEDAIEDEYFNESEDDLDGLRESLDETIDSDNNEKIERKKLKTSSLKILTSKLTPNSLILPDGYSLVTKTNLWKEGAVEVQDEASVVMANFSCFPDQFYPLLSRQPSTISPIAAFVKKKKAMLNREIPTKVDGQSKVINLFGTWGGTFPTSPFENEGAVPELPSDPAALTIVDACAGAGGKTLALADNLLGRGRVYAYDISDAKLKELQKRYIRAGLSNIQSKLIPYERKGIATGLKGLPEILSKFKSRADIVLVDAPCSGWGVLRRNPDLKWRLTGKDAFGALETLPKVQLSLLESYAPLVSAGGRLVFGVCTLRSAETINVVSEFLEKNPAFDPMGGGFLGPLPESADAFFMFAMQKKNKAAMSLMNSELAKLRNLEARKKKLETATL